MKKLLSNLIPVLLFFGILSGCETTDPVIDEAQLNIYTQNYDSAHASLDRFIEQNPNNGIGYYYKALAYSQQAANIQPPSDRKPYYRDFRESIVKSRDLFEDVEEKPDEAAEVDNLILNAWGREHNASLEYATNDSVMASMEEPLKVAVAHLENAIIVNPDSTLSYDVLSQIHYMDGNFEAAAEVLAESMELKNPPPAEDYDRIAAFYAQTGKNEKAIDMLQEGLELYPDSVSLTQKLADNYMNVGERGRAIEVLEELIASDPDNPQYHLVLGTIILTETEGFTQRISEIYDEIYDLRSELRNASGSKANDLENQIETLEEEIDERLAQTNELNDLAEKELLRTLELRPDDETAYNALGVLYQNRAAVLFGQRNYTDDIDLADQYDAEAKALLQKAMENYEKTVELNPENKGAWQSLANIYITLDMQDKYEEAIEKAGN
ncbi:MAG: tetratricopeptide repeat protein [Gracilimonas sp.]|uniref:tetratricopeptide repeat protein n=1 Tax=Gracilimonas sp. TaxID=1974203 RepID=UPI00199C3FD0|nr:tetratricopeptide repeat protein [Gracilimonas sp.]MBD3617622.1 tetratricopeptide repeat protein [Gracilimonas sp.]